MKTEYALLMTLGHNSSALAVNTATGEVIGYEEERLTRVKSDSSFPKQALSQIMTHVSPHSVVGVYISHWFDSLTFRPWTSENKYWSAQFMRTNFPHLREKDYVHTGAGVGGVLSHHDAHAYSCVAFINSGGAEIDITDWHTIVADGFGTDREVISIYRGHKHGLDLIARSQGYSRSLGLLFQYAAEALGMDGINDVYKFLGYQAAVSEDTKSNGLLQRFINSAVAEYLDFSTTEVLHENKDEGLQLIDYEALGLVRDDLIGLFSHPDLNSREAAGYVIQQIVERVVLGLIKKYRIKKLMVSGGCFYNVKLNNRIINDAGLDMFSVMPLAGDQGAAIGVYEYYRHGGQAGVRFDDMCWGIRPNLGAALYSFADTPYDNFHVRRSFNSSIQEIAQKLNNGEIVNVVRRRAEFGPRALCKTSTLAPPEMKCVNTINSLNGRNSVMPMAPVVNFERVDQLFKCPGPKIVNSNRFMICSLDYRDDVDPEDFMGAALRDHHGYTGRPQVVLPEVDHAMTLLLDEVEYPCLINTSFNGHGEPIILRVSEAYELHESWMRKRNELPAGSPAFSTYVFIEE